MRGACTAAARVVEVEINGGIRGRRSRYTVCTGIANHRPGNIVVAAIGQGDIVATCAKDSVTANGMARCRCAVDKDSMVIAMHYVVGAAGNVANGTVLCPGMHINACA